MSSTFKRGLLDLSTMKHYKNNIIIYSSVDSPFVPCGNL